MRNRASIWRYIVVTGVVTERVSLIVSFEEDRRSSGLEIRTVRDRDHHHPIAVSIEKLAADGRPDRLIAALRRYQPPALSFGKRPDVDFPSSRFVGDVGEPPTVMGRSAKSFR